MNSIPKRLVALIWTSLILFAATTRAAVVTANFTSATTVPVTAASYTATGNTVNFTLAFAPATDTNLTVVNNTGSALIQGSFDNLAQGQRVDLTFRGVTYPYVANYCGGTGNDLVLQWANRRLFAWGYNSNGQLGNNTTTNSSVPVAIDMSGVLAGKALLTVSAGGSHCLAVCADGTVAAWGANTYGQLGNSSTTDSWVPVAVNQAGALAGKLVIAVAAGENHSLALCVDGTLVAWGTNGYGQLGNGGTSTSTEPMPVDQTGVLAGKTVIAIAAGYSHSLALCADGTVAAWGSNSYGELGNGSTSSSSLPVLVNRAGVLAGKTVTAISAAGSSSYGNISLAVCADGSMAGWGYNSYGQLGNGSTTNNNLPVAVTQSGVLSGKTLVAAAAEDISAVALCSNGIVAAWGNDASGQLGNSANTNSSVPVLVTQTGVLSGKTVSAIAAGHGFAFALCTDATLAAWGYNWYGQVGNNTTSNSNVPVLVTTTALRSGERFSAIRGGSNHSLALTASPPPPVASTLAASGISDTGATLNGNVAANGNSTTVSFDYGLTASYGASASATPASLTGTAVSGVSATLTGLLPGSTYHYRVVATGSNGTSKGADASFTTTTTACLAGLTVDAGTLVPAFDFKAFSYEVVLPAATAHLTVTPVTADPAASLTLNGTALASGSGVTLDVVEGSNVVSIVVTAADHVNTLTYSIKATRLPAVYAFNAASTVPVTVADFNGTGSTATFALNFAPVAGTNLTVVKNTGLRPVRGPFDNLAQGQAVNLTYGGVTYGFVANYWGGSGNDLVLQWANTRLLDWGDNSYAQLGNNTTISSSTGVSVDMTGVLAGKTVIAVTTGTYHSLALCSDGTLAAWGSNSNGQLGNGGSSSNVPVLVTQTGVLAGKTVVAIAAGYGHSLALCSDGTLAAWGYAYNGQLGDNGATWYSTSLPVLVNRNGVLAGKTVVAIAAGDNHSLALCADGTLAAWGDNSSGELGNGSTISSTVPVLVNQAGVLAGKAVVAIAAGSGNYTLALCSDGTLAGWGANGSGQLGNGATTSSSVPVLVNQAGVLAGKPVTAVAAGASHSLALCADGTVAAWGYNYNGQLGDGTTTDKNVPVLVTTAGVLAGKTVAGIGRGNYFSLAWCADGTAVAWGSNSTGQLGNGTTTSSSVPLLVNTTPLRTGERIVTMRGGSSHSLALLASPPPPVAATLAASGMSDTAATVGGSVNAQGSAATVAFEYGLSTTYGALATATPAAVSGTTATAVSATLGGLLSGVTYHYRVVATNSGGTVRGADMTFTTSTAACLSGLTASGAALMPAFDKNITAYSLTVPSTTASVTLTPVVLTAGATVTVAGVAVDSGSASAPLSLTTGGNAISIVVNAAGGGNTKTYTVTVTRVPAVLAFGSSSSVPVTAADFNATGLVTNFVLNYAPAVGAVLTVVRNTGTNPIQGNFSNLAQGQLVPLTFGGVTYPFLANYFGGTGNDLVLQWANTRVLAWGYNSSGQLGNGTTTSASVPLAVDRSGVLANKAVMAVSAGSNFTVALCADGSLAGWGYNDYGQLGSSSNSTTPVALGQTGVMAGKVAVAVATGASHVVALCADGTVAAWGYNGYGQLGNSSTTNSSVPVLVARTGVLAGKTVTAVCAGSYHSLALCSDGTLAAWGYNGYGQLGNGSFSSSSVPVLVTQSGVLAGKSVVAMGAGDSSSVALCSDGTLAAWGSNSNGQLGNNSTISSSLPVLVTQSGVLAGKTVTAIATGASHILALCSDGTLAAWGYDNYGQLGNNSTTNSGVPVLVTQSGVLAGKSVAAIATGGSHSFALCSDATLAAWGYNYYGQVGNNSTSSSSVPVLVNTSALQTGEYFMAADGGAQHSLALVASPPAPVVTSLAATAVADTTVTLNGSVNANGSAATVAFEYGLTTAYGTSVAATPGSLSGTTTTTASAALSNLLAGTTYHYRIVASSAGGTTRGADMSFTTDTATTLASLTPSAGALTPAFAPAVTSYAMTLPFATTGITLTPVVARTGATVKVAGSSVASGSASATIPLVTGNNTIPVVVTSPSGTSMQTYTVTVTRVPDPFVFNAASDVPVTAAAFDASGLTASFSLRYAPVTGTTLTLVNNTGSAPIQGRFTNLAQGQVVMLDYFGATYLFVANYFGGSGNDLVLQWANTRVLAWGYNSSGQIGNGTTTNASVPVAVDRSGVLANKAVMAVSAGSNFNVALCSDGSLAGWGASDYGQLGSSSSATPVAIGQTGAMAGKVAIAVATGASHVVALCSDGSLAAWGYNGSGQLGNGSSTYSISTPVAVTQTGVLANKRVVAVAAGDSFNLVLCSDGTVAGWGNNSSGQLGNNSTTYSTVPVLVTTSGVLSGKSVKAITAGGGHSLALCSDGTLAAWGYNYSGQLGNNSTTDSSVPILINSGVLSGKSVTAIAAGSSHSLALCSDGTFAAWGYDYSGQLGNNSTTSSSLPVLVTTSGVLSGKAVTAISAWSGSSFALCSDGTLAAWGSNNYGQLGNNSTTNSSVPVTVSQSNLLTGERFSAVGDGSLALVAAPAAGLTPTIADRSNVIGTSQTLAWSLEPLASSYRVYFGTDPTAVANATATSPEYLGSTTTTSWSGSLPALVLDGNYYWRVDTVFASGTRTGNTWTFSVAPLMVTPSRLDLLCPVGLSPQTYTMSVTGPAGTAWSASTTTSWLSAIASGSTPGTLAVTVNVSGLAAGIYQGSVRCQSATDVWSFPVALELLAVNYTLAKADLGAPYVYAISQAASGTDDRALLLVIDTRTNAIARAVAAGRSVTDFAIHYPENRIYLTNWKTGVLRAFDRNTLAQVQTYQFETAGPIGYGQGGIYHVSAGKAGRVILEETDQWIDIWLINTANGAVVATNSSEYAGDGDADPTGRYYYHSGQISTNAVTRYDISGDSFVATTPVGSASSASVVVIPDGSKVAVGTKVFDTLLGLKNTLASSVVSATRHGEVLFSNTTAFNGTTGQSLATLPVSATIQAVSADQKKLFEFSGSSLSVFDITTIATLPSSGLVPGIADGSTVIGTSQQLSWLQDPTALSYDVYFGTSAAALSAATKASAEFLGNVTGTQWTGSLPTLSLGSTYYWRVDIEGYSSVLSGSVWSFQIAPVDVSPRSVNLASPAGAPVTRQALALTSTVPLAWTASSPTPWLTLRASSGTTPATLQFDVSTSGLAVGSQSGSIVLQAGGKTFTVPVNLSIVTLNVTQLIPNPNRAVVYGINSALTGEGYSYLLEIDAATAAILRTLPIGFSPTDADLDPATGRLYVANWGYPQTRVIDVNNWLELPSLNLGTDIYRLEITPKGRLVTAGENQWVTFDIWNASTGAHLAVQSQVYEGDGQADPTGNFFYGCGVGISNGQITKYNISADTFVSTATSPVIASSTYNLLLSPDGSRVFWGRRVMDSDLKMLTLLPGEVYGTNRSGDLAIGSSLVWWADSGVQVASLAFDSTVAAVSANDAYLLRFNATTRALQSLAMSSLTSLPGPWPRPGQTVDQSPQRISWSPVTAATAYRVYIAPNAAALQAMTGPVATVSTTYYDLPAALAYGQSYFWRVDAVVASGVTTGTVQSFAVAFPDATALQVTDTGGTGTCASIAAQNLLVGTGSSARIYSFDPTSGAAAPLQYVFLPANSDTYLFGSAVAMDGGKAAVGASAYVNPATGGGAAFIYQLGTYGFWSNGGPLAPPTPVASEAFAHGMAASGNMMLVGSGINSGLSGRVVAYVTEPTVTQVQVFSAADAQLGDGFGYTIAMDGNQAIIAAPGSGVSSNRLPSLYAFSRSPATGQWSQTQKISLVGAATGDLSGKSVAIAGDTLVTNRGSTAILVYTRNSSGQWIYSTAIASSGFPNSTSAFGNGLALSGNHLFIGDSGASYAGTSGGVVFSAMRSGTTWTAGPVMTPPSTSYTSFGNALAARDGWLLSAGGEWLFRIDAAANHTPRFLPGFASQAVAGRALSTAVLAVDPDGNAGLSIDLLGGPAWLGLTDNGNGSAVLAGMPTGKSGDVSEVQLRVRDNAGAQALYTYRLTLLAPTDLPVLTSDPAGGDYGVGQSLTLSATVSGIGPFQWQWYYNGSPITGATGASLAIQELALTDAGRYSVSVSNIVGPDVSADAVITVHAANRFGGDWPTFGSSPARTGRQPVALDGCVFIPAWNQTVQSGIALRRAAIANGRAFVVSNSSFSTGASIKAVDLATGAIAWSTSTAAANSTCAPTVFNGRVYFTRINNENDTFLFCLDANTGAKMWSSLFGAQWETYEAPAVVDQGIYIGGGTYGGIYGFNFDGSTRFFQSLEQYDQWTPAISNGHLFSWVGGNFREHNMADGTVPWSVSVGWNWQGWSTNTTPAIVGDSAVIYDNTEVVCMDLPSHSVRWRKTGTFSGSFAIGAGMAYGIQGTAVRSYALADGTPGPVYQTNATGLGAQAVLFNDRLLVANSAQTYVFNLADGHLLQTLGAGGLLSYSNGHLLAAGGDGVLRAFAALNNNPKLAALALSTGTMLPAFETLATSYIATVPFATASLTVTPTTEYPAATVQVNGVAVASGAASGALPLAVGNNTITTRVTAEDGIDTMSYTITVTRLPENFVFNSATDVPVTATGFATGGYPVNVMLNYAPAPGTVLTMVNNTGLGFIHGTFGNLAQGQRMGLTFNGKTYGFVANYYGGSGNDLVLQWAATQVVAWGSNSSGQLGDATTTRRLLPTSVDNTGVLAGKTVVAVAEGYLHSLALCSDGTLAAWGYNVYGQLGNNGAVASSVPVAVDRSGALAGKTVIAIAAGPFHNLALCADGSVAAWGYNNYGQLGTGDTVTSRVPVVVPPAAALAGKQVVAVAAGAYHSFALCDDGTLAAWGFNDDGELGSGSSITSCVPVAVATPAGKRVASLAAGQYHTLALCADGALLAWGYNNRGQLGNNSIVSSNTPLAISAFGALAGKTVVATRASGAHSLALCADGALAAWGWNNNGQLGQSGVTQSNLPVAVNMPGATLTQVAIGGSHSLGLSADGTLAAWGDNAYGQLGNETTTPSAVPAPVDASGLAAGARWMAVASGSAALHNLAVVGLPALTLNANAALDESAMALLDRAFGLHLDPNQPGHLPQAQRIGSNYVIEFSQPAGVTDIAYGAEWSASMLPGTWIEVPDTGTGDVHIFSLPMDAAPQRFLRLKVTSR